MMTPSTNENFNATDDSTIPPGYQRIREGSAQMLYPINVVFYNPVQVQNRDLSILMISMYVERCRKRHELYIHKKKEKIFRMNPGKVHSAESDSGQDCKGCEDTFQGITILEALAASGLRSIRYWKEIEGVRRITVNDFDPAAIDLATQNIISNQLSHVLLREEEEKQDTFHYRSGIQVHLGDATHVMYMARRPPQLQQLSSTQHKQTEQYDVIDLDPYGSATKFLDAAVQAVVHGGLLAITCTDMVALGGSHPETCYGRYASMPIPRAQYLQELALRILLCNIATTAAKYGRTIKPILSVGMHFYVRVFVEIWDDKAAVNDLSLHIGTVYQSTQCPSFHIVPHGQRPKNRNIWQPSRAPLYPVCPETGGPFKTAGPIWLGPLHDSSVVHEALTRLENTVGKVIESSNPCYHLATREQLHGLLTVVTEELPDVPLYYVLSNLSQTLGCPTPPIDSIRAALINAGYRVSSYHKEPEAIKTDAPNKILWDIFRSWCSENPPPPKSNKIKNKKYRYDENGKQMIYDDDTHDKYSNLKSCPSEQDNEQQNVAEKILSVKSSLVVDFTVPEVLKHKKKAQRFPMNPQSNWGPKPKASGYKESKK